MADIERLIDASTEVLSDINGLLLQLTKEARPCTQRLLQSIVESPLTELWVAKEGTKIVGMGVLATVLRPEGASGRIEDVVVDEDQRGKGIGEALMRKLIERAKALGAVDVSLTTRSSRTAANSLYQKLGFSIRETNVYQIKL